jgi:hypothetical protein
MVDRPRELPIGEGRRRQRVPKHDLMCETKLARRDKPNSMVTATIWLPEHHRRRLPVAVHFGQQ